MPSVLGLLEARERKIREEVVRLRAEAERVQVALGGVEHALQRLVEARATVAEVLSEPPSAVADPARGAVAGAVVPHRADGMTASALATGLSADRHGAAVGSGPGGHAVPATGGCPGTGGGPGEGRGVAVEGETPGGTRMGGAGAAGSVHRARGVGRLKPLGRRPARRLLISMVIDHSTMASCMTGSDLPQDGNAPASTYSSTPYTGLPGAAVRDQHR